MELICHPSQSTHKNLYSQKKKTESKGDNLVFSVNSKAFHDNEILERYEAGIVLTGTEIKSIRAGKAELRDAYARAEKGELWLLNAHIAPYDPASTYNHEPRRARKLLLHREEIKKLTSTMAEKGLTVVALRLDIKNHVAKVEVGLARGKRQYAKRRAMIAL